MRYLWTEDRGAGLHFWQLVNNYLYQNKMIIESKGSNQGILDAVRELKPLKEDTYYLAFDIVYDNMDIVNKLLELQEIAVNYPEQIILLDMICFEHIVFAFSKLVEWTGTGHKDIVEMRKHILNAIKEHKIDLDEITDEKTRMYLMRFKRYSTEKIIKSMTYMLTDGDEWSVKGSLMGNCWHQDCCILQRKDKKQCHLETMTGAAKIKELFFEHALRNSIVFKT